MALSDEEVDGEPRELTRGELMVHVRSSDPDLRARAYQELYRVYGEDGALLALIYAFSFVARKLFEEKD